MEGADRQFFQIAATIIPLVLFGSVLARLYRPPDIYTRLRLHHKLTALLLVLGVLFICSAEIFAIAIAVGGGGTGFIAGYVSIAVVVAVFGFGMAVLLPWAVRFHRAGHFGWLAAILAATLFLVFMGASAVKLEGLANDAVLEEEQLDEFSKVNREADSAQLALIRAQIAIQADHHTSSLEKRELVILKSRNKAAQALLLANEP
jgi:hypothetical protein